MAKKKEINRNEEFIKMVDKADIEEIDMCDACDEYNEIFNSNCNLLRSTPFETMGGLLVCEMRIIWTMREMKAIPGKPTRKGATIDGRVIGDYHPHGGVYDTIIRLAQPWQMNQPLVLSKSQIGECVGTGPAAMRYTEMILSPYCMDCFFDEFDLSIADMKKNFTEEKEEPNFSLATKYPNILVNGAKQIGKGIAPSIPPYNFTELCKLAKIYLENPEENTLYLVPDFPNRSSIIDMGDDAFRQIWFTGKGKIKLRGDVEIDEGNHVIIVKSTPVGTAWKKASRDKNKPAGIVGAIVELQNSGEISGITNFESDNTPDTINVKIHYDKKTDPYQMMQKIYTKTQLQDGIHADTIVVKDFEVMETNPRDLLIRWVEKRISDKRKILNARIVKNRERAHLIEVILRVVYTDTDRITKLIKSCANKLQRAKKLMDVFGISSLQAATIARFSLGDLTTERKEAFEAEYKTVTDEAKKYEEISKSEKKIRKAIIEDLDEGIRKYGGPRRSKVITLDGEQLIKNTKHTLVFTKQGYIKKLPLNTNSIGELKDGDIPMEIIKIGNANELLVFDDRGIITKIPVSEIPDNDLRSYGTEMHTLGVTGTKIVALKVFMPKDKVSKLKTKPYVVFVTRNGIVKKTLLEHYLSIKKNLAGIVIGDDDELCSVTVITGNKEMILYTNKGFGTRFNTKETKETNRMTKGSRGIQLTENEYVIGTDIIDKKDKGIFVLTSKGYGKLSSLSNFPASTDGSTLRITSLDEGSVISCIKAVEDDDVVNIYMKNGIEEVNMAEMDVTPRMAKCKKIIGVRKGDHIIDVEIKKVEE